MIESLTQPHSQVTEKIADSQRKKKKDSQGGNQNAPNSKESIYF